MLSCLSQLTTTVILLTLGELMCLVCNTAEALFEVAASACFRQVIQLRAVAGMQLREANTPVEAQNVLVATGDDRGTWPSMSLLGGLNITA